MTTIENAKKLVFNSDRNCPACRATMRSNEFTKFITRQNRRNAKALLRAYYNEHKLLSSLLDQVNTDAFIAGFNEAMKMKRY